MVPLKNCYNEYKGFKFKTRLNMIYWDVKFAIQRAWNGYDISQVFDLNDELFRYLERVLLAFDKLKYKCVMKMNDDGTPVMTGDKVRMPVYFTDYEFNNFIKEIQVCIKIAYDEMYLSKLMNEMYGKVDIKSNKDTITKRRKDEARISNNAKKYVFKQLSLYFDQLWN